MDPPELLELKGPPRKKMRKGTKSCTECRRRKIRCTSDPEHPGACKECRARDLACVDQSQKPLNTNGSSRHTEQPYSLRERITRLEGIVNGILEVLDEPGAKRLSSLLTPEEETGQVQSSKKPALGLTASSATTEIDSSEEQTGNAPIFQLFDNDIVSRKTEPNDDKFTGSKDMSPKAQEVRAQLLSLLPPQSDRETMLEASILLLPAWENSFPEICHKCRYGSNTGRTDFESPMAPAEVAQILVFLAMIVAQLPIGFNYAGLEVPFDPQEFTSRCVSEVDRLIVHDDHFAATLPGIECQIILSKYLLNEGRPRKAWLANRRAIDFARLAGMHLSTAKPPRPGDILFNRRLRIWCQLVGNDRFISLILGLPHAVPDSSYVPQVEMYLRASESTLDKYMWQLGIIIGKIIDRNQAGGEPCLPSTLRLEQDLEDIAKQTPEHWWDPDAQCGGMDERYQERYYERIILQFIHNLLRGMLHMPFITKSDRKFQYCHAAAAESAQNCLRLYKILRLEVKPYLCKICDFFAFMMGMLLAVQLFSGESSHRDEEQLARDWETVNEIATILRQAGTESAGAVAAESATILGGFYNCYVNRNSPDHSWGRTCKITVPYFGTITVALGEKLFGNRTAKPQQSQGGPSIATKESAAQLSTPPFSNSEDPPSAEAHDVLNNSSEMATASYPTESWTQNNMPAIPTVDLDFNAFQGFLGGFGEEMWPNLDMDLALDQGWGVDWLGGSSMS